MKNLFKTIAIVVIAASFAFAACSGKKDGGGADAGQVANNAKKEVAKTILWKDIEYGMSIDDVKKLYPSAEIVPLDENDPAIVDVLRYNEGVVIQKEVFVVDFYFEDKKAVAVDLSPKKDFQKIELGMIKIDELFRDIARELSLKYGSPVKENQGSAGSFSAFKEITWNVEDLIVDLFCVHPFSSMYNEPVILSLTYSTGTVEKEVEEDNL